MFTRVIDAHPGYSIGASDRDPTQAGRSGFLLIDRSRLCLGFRRDVGQVTPASAARLRWGPARRPSLQIDTRRGRPRPGAVVNAPDNGWRVVFGQLVQEKVVLCGTRRGAFIGFFPAPLVARWPSTVSPGPAHHGRQRNAAATASSSRREPPSRLEQGVASALVSSTSAVHRHHPRQGDSPHVVFRLSTKLPISSPMTVTRYSWPVSISITASAWPAGVAAEKSPKPVVVSTVKLK
jgi:hypothetical protein